MRNIADGSLTHKVILDRTNGDLIMPPQGWNLIAYLGSFSVNTTAPIEMGYSGAFILVLYLITSFIVLLLWVLLGRNNVDVSL
jgi:hypothetical protein